MGAHDEQFHTARANSDVYGASGLNSLAAPFLTALGFKFCYHTTSPHFMPNRTNALALEGPHTLLFLFAIDMLLQRRL